MHWIVNGRRDGGGHPMAMTAIESLALTKEGNCFPSIAAAALRFVMSCLFKLYVCWFGMILN